MQNKNNEKKVAIILVNYNGYAETIQCIESLKNIDYDNYHVFIVENGSTNNSYDILSRYLVESDCARFCTLKKSKENLGFSGGNNIGIKEAIEQGYEYVMLLNNDTIVTPDFLNILINNADNKSIVTPRIMYWNEKDKNWYAGGKLSKVLGRAWHNNIGKKYLKNRDDRCYNVSFISGCCMLMHVDVIKKIGLLEEKYFLYYEDTEYCWRADDSSVQMKYVGSSVIYHNVSSSTGNNSRLMNYYKIRNRLYLINDHASNYTKWIAVLFAIFEDCYGILIKKYSFETVCLGIKDYLHNKIGKM